MKNSYKIVLIMFLVCIFTVAGCDSANNSKIANDASEEESENLYISNDASNVSKTDSDVTESDSEKPVQVSIEWDEKQVLIPELQNEYEIWFFADSHIIVPDETESEEIKNYIAERASVFANEQGVDSTQIFSYFIKQANKKRPDLVLFGGDILDFPSKANVAFLQSELEKLEVPYVFVMGNHDWTYPWEYMTETGSATFRPLFQEMMTGNMDSEGSNNEDSSSESLILNTIESADGYASVTELEDLTILAVDDSSNQVASQAQESIEYAYELNKPIVLLQHVPFSTENLIKRTQKDWANPVTLGMQVHGGLAPNDVSADLFGRVYDDNSLIRVALGGHVHFAYEEKLSEWTTLIITDAAYKGKAVKLTLRAEEAHTYFCDKFTLTLDDKQVDLKELEANLSSVSALQPITNNQLFILGRMDESNNMLLIYDFTKEEFVFQEKGTTMCWIQDDYTSARYLKDDVVYDLEGNIIYKPDSEHTISMIEYVDKDFMVTIEDLEHMNSEQVWMITQ